MAFATELVNEKFDLMEGIAESVYDTTMNAINALALMADDLVPINENISLDETDITVNEINLEAPTIDTDDLVVAMPADPEPPVLIDDSLILSDLPSFPTLNVSDINAGDNTYSSALLTALRTKLYDDLVNGSIGLSEEVEDATWRREEERSLQALEDTLDRNASLWAEMGWDLPDGALAAVMQEPQLTHLNNRLTMSRDISIKSAELALQNCHFIITQGIAFEAMLINWANAVAQRIFEASKAVVEAQIAKFSKEVDAVAGERDSIIRTALARIQYNLGKVQLYTSQIEAFIAKLKSEDTRISAVAKVADIETNLFRANADFLISKAGLEAKVLDTRLQQSLGNMNLLIHDKEVRSKNYEAMNQLRVHALDALGRISAQMMAGVWSSVSAGAQISSEYRQEESTVYQHNYTE